MDDIANKVLNILLNKIKMEEETKVEVPAEEEIKTEETTQTE